MLSGKQRSFLRSRGNDLQTIIQIGKEGITGSQLEQIEEALTDHELIKIRVLDNSGKEVKGVAEELATVCEAEIVQTIGNVLLLYRRNEEEPIYNLPK